VLELESQDATPHLLFLPGGGSEGAGEYARTLIVAEALREHWPKARIGFVTGAQHPRFAFDDFERHTIEGKVSKNVEAVNAVLRETLPDLVIFDNRGQTAQIVCAKRMGIRTVFVCTQPQFVRRAFRLRRLRHLDQLWIVQRRFGPTPSALSWAQKLRLALSGGPEICFLDTIFPETNGAHRRELLLRLGLDGEPFALFVAGGGGYQANGRPVPEIFLEAAKRVSKAHGIRCAAVMGPLFRGGVPELPGLVVLKQVSPRDMVGLLRDAHVVACGGGGMAGQALAQNSVCVVAPAGGPDQPERIRVCATNGLLEPSELAPDAIATGVLGLLEDDARRRGMRSRLEACAFRNGLPAAVTHIERLL